MSRREIRSFSRFLQKFCERDIRFIFYRSIYLEILAHMYHAMYRRGVCEYDGKSRDLLGIVPVCSAQSLSSPSRTAFQAHLVNLGPLPRASVADIQFDSLNRIFDALTARPVLILYFASADWLHRRMENGNGDERVVVPRRVEDGGGGGGGIPAAYSGTRRSSAFQIARPHEDLYGHTPFHGSECVEHRPGT